jgi:hypothetical protein
MPDTQLFVFTAGDASARAHLNDSILNPIDPERIASLFPQDEAAELQALAAEQGLYAWGAVDGQRNKPTWESMAPGDWVLCVYDARYRFVARVVRKAHNAPAAREIWGELEPGKTWEYMYFITPPVPIDVPLDDLASELNARYMGFTRIADPRVSEIVDAFGSVDSFIKLRLLPQQSRVDQFKALMQRYADDGVVFRSPERGVHYFIKEVLADRCVVERVDANEPAEVMLDRYGRNLDRVKQEGGVVPLNRISNTVAKRMAMLQGPELCLSVDRKSAVLLSSPAEALSALLDSVENMNTQSVYKPAVLMALMDAVEQRSITQNAFSFDDLLPFARKVFSRYQVEAGDKESGYGFFHLAGEPFWLLAYEHPQSPLTGTPSPNDLRNRVRSARLKEPFFDVVASSKGRAKLRELLANKWFGEAFVGPFFIIRSNVSSDHDDALGAKYAYHTNVPNWRKLQEGATVIVDRKLSDGSKVLLGYGELGQPQTSEPSADGVTIIESPFDQWAAADEPIPYNAAIGELVKGAPGYNHQHAIRPLTESAYRTLKAMIDAGSNQINAVDHGYPLNTILFGAPGVGKTFITREIAVRIADAAWWQSTGSLIDSDDERAAAIKVRYEQLRDEQRVHFTTFHQSFSYEDFVEGIQAKAEDGVVRYGVEPGVFRNVVDCATQQADSNVVLIIDEINRGNVARILGELITLLEPSKRHGAADEQQVVLPYSKKPFSVPNNLYVVGTMNTADKSLTQIDVALRRRFQFVEMSPDPSKLAGVQVHGVDLSDLLVTLNDRIEVLLDRDHVLGHAYFLGISPLDEGAPREAELARVFEQNILPLLQEYFFDDWERIAWVLNDNRKTDPADRFLTQPPTPLNALFGDDVVDQLSDRRFIVNKDAFRRPGAYSGILG